MKNHKAALAELSAAVLACDCVHGRCRDFWHGMNIRSSFADVFNLFR